MRRSHQEPRLNSSSRFQDFIPEEILKIINMFEEMPSGFHKIQGLNYLN